MRTAAPMMATMLIMKENSAAAAGATPSARAAATVLPLREMPGRMAKAWAQPIRKAARQLGSPPRAFGSVARVVHRMPPVTSRQIPAVRDDSYCASRKSPASNTASTAGTVATPSFRP